MSSTSSGSSPEAASERIRRRLSTMGAAAPESVSDERWALREAAALLSSFDAAELAPAHPVAGGQDPLIALIDDCEAVGEPARGRWRLRSSVRKQALRRLGGPEEAMRAFSANRTEGEDPVERMVRRYLTRDAPPLERQDLEQLACTMRAVRWLREIPGLSGVPSAEEVMAAQQRKQLFGPLEALVGPGFRGREKQLDRLRLHVGVLNPEALRNRLRRQGRKLNPFSGGRRRPLMVYGPPGIGKSTLLARFALEHSASPMARIPFVFVDFERPTLSVAEPATLLAEAARQLAVQFPGIAGPLADVARRAEQEATRQRQASVELSELEEVSTARATVHREAVHRLREESTAAERELIYALVGALEREPSIVGTDAAAPLLFVLDSFEQVQYRSSPYLRHLREFFSVFQDRYPRIRVVVSGRARVQELAINERAADYLQLEEFDAEASTAFLIDEGVDDRALAADLAEQFGGNPLSLKLTARLARRYRDDTTWTNDVATRQWLLFRVRDEQVQNRLYLRLLGSADNPEIAALGHPGLVLRRITPEIIMRVLAEPCKVAVPTLERAEELFAALAAQVDLVEPAVGGVLRHRPDLRQDMLPLVVADKPVEVELVERLAVAYYREQSGPVARAEEIYHRLRLGEPPAKVDEVWEDKVRPYLAGALPEVPIRAQGYLAARLTDAHVPAEVLEAADFQDWEVLTAREVEDLLDQTGSEKERRRSAQEALKLMQAREGWSPGSPLYRLKAEALDAIGDEKTAQEAVEAGISAIGEQSTVGTATLSRTLFDLLLLAARLYQERGEARNADRNLEQAESVAQRLGRGVDVLSTLIYRARLLAQQTGAPVDAVRTRAASRFLALDEAELRTQPAIVRSAAIELGANHGDVLARAIDMLGVELRPEQRVQLVHEVVRLVEHDAQFRTWLHDYAAARGVRLGTSAADVQTLVDRLVGTDRLFELAKALVAVSDDDSPLRQLLIAMVPETTTSELLGGDLGPALA